MTYFLTGRLCGYLCDECDEPLTGTVVRLYSVERGEVVAAVAAAPKDTVDILQDGDIDAARPRLLAEVPVNNDGSYRAELPEQYNGGPLEIELFVPTVRGAHPATTGASHVQLHLTTLQPQFRETANGVVAVFDWCIPSRLWCSIRARFGAWVVCGRVTVCDTGEPVSGVTVHAFDRDWLQDDALGTGTSDAAGHYRIDYAYGDFTTTPFSWLHIELKSGPDVYFRVEGPGGTPLLVELASKGRSPGRENVGRCACIDLCLTGDLPQNPPTIPMFTKVGQYRIDPVYGEFTPSGTTTSGGYAFTSDIPLVGIMPDPLSSQAIEYRFSVNGTPVDAADMAATVIGELEFFAWDTVLSAWVVRSADVWANNPGATISIPQSGGPPLNVSVNTAIKAGGWIEAPRTNGLVPGGPGRFIPNGTLCLLHTTKYTDEQFDLRPVPVAAGDDVPLAQRSMSPTFTVVFEARSVPGGAPVGTNALTGIAFSNITNTYKRHAYWGGGDQTSTAVASLGIQEMVTGGGCSELGDTIHILYTICHPYAGVASVYFDGNPILPAPLTPTLVGGHTASGPTGVMVDISLLAKCAYILWLQVPLLLTVGYGSIGAVEYDHIGFCKR